MNQQHLTDADINNFFTKLNNGIVTLEYHIRKYDCCFMADISMIQKICRFKNLNQVNERVSYKMLVFKNFSSQIKTSRCLKSF